MAQAGRGVAAAVTGARSAHAALLVVLWCVLYGLAGAAAHSDTPAPSQPLPTPRLFLTQNHGITAKVPAGLTYCPLPDDWVGANHGSIMYLVPPAACSPDHHTMPVPHIGIFYGYNAADRPHHHRPPRRAAELAEDHCRRPNLPLPPGLALVGRPGVGCRHDEGDWVEIELLALVHPQHPRRDEFSGTILMARLKTTKARLSGDLATFAAWARTIRACTPYWARPEPALHPCPPGNSWW